MIKVCKIDEIDDETMILLCVNKKEIIVGKHNGRIIAFDAHCPHRYAYLHRGKFKDDKVICPLHDFEFDLYTGKLVRIDERYQQQSPEWKKSGDLRLYKTEIKDGYLYIDL